jgi:hypothetical protein
MAMSEERLQVKIVPLPITINIKKKHHHGGAE